jgi:hypothetical protein
MRMTEPCFKKMDSNTPVCGVHLQVLVKYRIAIDVNAPELGSVDCLVCPVSRAVVRELKKP